MTLEELLALGLTDEQAAAVMDNHASSLRAAEEPHLRRLLAGELQNRGASSDAAALMAAQHPLDGLTICPDGSLQGASDAADSLAARWPGLFSAAQPLVPRTELNPPAASVPALPEDLSRMTAEEINARWSEVRAVLAGRG